VEWDWQNLCGKNRQYAKSVSSAMSQDYCESPYHFIQKYSDRTRASEIPLDDRTREKLNDLCRKKENDEMAALELKRNKLYRRPRYNKPEFEINHGQWLVDQHATNGEDISCHYNCLISSSGLYVRPQDEGGLPPKQYKKFTIGNGTKNYRTTFKDKL